jgi:uncharacterized protein (TIGR02231 family)
MKKSFLFSIILLLTASFCYSQITDVTVYQDRAVITRAITEKGKAGLQETIFKNIPLKTNPDSIRAKGFVTKDNSMKILDIRTEKNYTVTTNEEIDTLKKQIETEKKELLKLNSKKTRINDLKKNLEVFAIITNKDVKENLNNGSFSPKQWDDALSIYSTNTEKLDSDLFNTDEEIQKINERIKVLEDQYNRGMAGNNIYTLDVYVSYKLLKDGDITVLLNYSIKDAGWIPIYDCRCDLKSGNLSIEYFAKVYQNTGENWDNVNLTLSTARPDLSGQVPSISPWEIDYQEQILRKYRSKESPMAAPKATYAEEMEKKAEVPAMMDKSEERNEAVVESQGFSIEYAITTKSTVFSGKKETRVTISSGIDMKPEMSWTMIPRYDQNAFLTAKIKNQSTFTFLPGEMNLYVDDSFIGKSSIDMINPAEEFNLSLGRDPRIKCEFKLESVEKSKIFSRNKEKRKYSIKITNNSNDEINLLIKDIIPKSIQTNKVSIKVNKIYPETKDIDNNSIYKWNIKLTKNAKITLTEEWEIEYPDTGYIIGL